MDDLLAVAPELTLPPDEKPGAFASNTVSEIDEGSVERYMDAAEAIASTAVSELDTLVPCDAGEQAACADAFIEDFVSRAFRRPLTESELTRFRSAYQDAEAEAGFAAGIAVVIEAALQSPSFLYLIESGTPSDIEGVYRLDDYGLATRLSFFLWNSIPDPELWNLAAAGRLRDASVLREQAERLLDHERATEALANFHIQLLDATGLPEAQRDDERFDEALVRDMLAETRDFVDYVVRDDDAKLSTLLTAPYSIIRDDDLLELYGVTPSEDRDRDAPVMLSPERRAGLLTQAAFLATHSHEHETAPMRRGLAVRTNFMCLPVPPPPGDIPPLESEDDGQPMTQRERLEAHAVNPECAGCHMMFDGIGFGFEHYDVVGAWRDDEHGLEIDASGELVGLADGEPRFDGAVELAQRLAESAQVRECFAQQWLSYAVGGRPIDRSDDLCSLTDLAARFEASGGDVRELMLDVVTSDAFRLTRPHDAEDR